MRKTSSILILCLVFPLFILSEDLNLSIQLLTKNKIELLPGSSANIAVMLINNTDYEKEFKLKIAIPNGLSTISDTGTIYVNANSKKLKIFTFYIQEYTIVNDYNIEITAYDNEKKIKIGEIKVPIYILPKYNLLLRTLPYPKHVFSGDTTSFKFLVQNLSNTKVNIEAEIVNINVFEKKTFEIEPDSIIIIKVLAKTSAEIDQYVKNSVSINIKISEEDTNKYFSTCIFDVIPNNAKKFDPYNRIPIKFSGLLVSDNQFEKRKYGAMFNIYGSGILSEKNKRFIDFKLHGPNRQGNPILGTSDEYYLKYSSINSKFIIGDNTYMLSNITEGARNGRGIEYEQKFKRASVGSFINFPRFYPDINKVYAIFGSFSPFKKLKISSGLLNKEFASKESAQLFTTSIISAPYKWVNFSLEYAIGKKENHFSKAYSTSVILNNSFSRIYFNHSYADKKFPGYISNTRVISTGINTSLFKKISISSNYNFNHQNIALDTLYANAPFSENMNLSLGYNLNFYNSISIGIFSRSREDRAIIKQFNYKETTARLTYNSKIKNLGLKVYGAYGQTVNLLSQTNNEVTNVLNADLALEYKINKYIFINANISYLGSQTYLIDDYTNYFYGGTLNANFKNTTILFQYQNNYEIAEIYRDRSLLALIANFVINKNQEIGINLNYNIRKNELTKKQLIGSISYIYTFNAPISKRNDVGSFKGKIINNGVDNIEGIIFTLDGNISITDKNGEFEFPFVKAGSHLLFIDDSKSGINSITEKPGPFKIEIIAGEKYIFEIGMTKAGKISGSLEINEDENSSNKSFIATKEKSFSLIIEASNEEEIFRVFSNSDGSFNFEDLRPGKWTIKVYERGLPNGYKLAANEFIIIVTSDKTENIIIKIQKISRKIKFQKNH